jgi:hypothetical protein
LVFSLRLAFSWRRDPGPNKAEDFFWVEERWEAEDWSAGGLCFLGLKRVMDSCAVLDVGSQNLRCGYCYSFPSDEEPRFVFPTAVESSSDQQPSTSGSSEEPPTIWPVRRGHVQHPEGMEALIYTSLYDHLGWDTDVEGALLIAEPLFVSRQERDQMTQLMFELFNVQGLYYQDQATLALYALGKLTGCVIDIGFGKVDVSTVSDGQVRAGCLASCCCATRYKTVSPAHPDDYVLRFSAALLFCLLCRWQSAATI